MKLKKKKVTRNDSFKRKIVAWLGKKMHYSPWILFSLVHDIG
jgi:hypothetical protein